MRLFVSATLFALGFSAFAQFTVTPNNSANQLAQKIAGSGLTVTNASLNCGVNAAGTFLYTGTNVGIAQGVVLTTGNAVDIANNGSWFCSVSNGNNYQDPSLQAIEPLAQNDVCILECDVIAMYANISINYIFGSEEYPEWVNAGFNDAFGFFLTGPNPSGGNYNGTNIGSLPNGTSVSINNVNAGANSTYFVDNYTSPNNNLVYDGYTTLITSVAPIVAGSTYHMKIAIADAGDEAYDSGILIQDSLFVSKPNNTTGLPYFEQNNLHFFPNPAHDQLRLSMKISFNAELELYNSNGQRQADPKIDTSTGTLDISGLEKGIYFLRVSDPSGRYYSGTFTKN